MIKKSIALALAFSVLYSQLLWAADARQMMRAAKSLFEEDDARRSGSMAPEALQKAQWKQTQEVAGKQALQDFQNNPNNSNTQFSLTTQSGDVLKYVGQRLDEVERPDGTVLKGIQLDATGNIVGAELTLADQSTQIYQDGRVLSYELPNGMRVYYDNGQIQKTVARDGQETLYRYVKNSAGQIIETILENASSQSTYDIAGKLKEIFIKGENSRTYYMNGILKKMLKADGGQYFFKSTQVGTDVKVTLDYYQAPAGIKFYYGPDVVKVEFSDASFLSNIVWAADGKAQDAVLNLVDGSRYFYVNKALVKLITSAGVTTTYAYTATGITVSVNGATHEYLTNRQLYRSIWSDGTVLYYWTSGPYAGLREKDVLPDGTIYLYEYALSAQGAITAQKRKLVRSTQTITDVQGSAHLTTASQPVLRFSMILPVTDLTQSYTVVKATNGSTKNLDINLNAGNASTYTFDGVVKNLSVTLTRGVLYNVEVAWETNRVAIYIYQSGNAKPTSPTAFVHSGWNPKFRIFGINAEIRQDATSSGAYTRHTSVSDKLDAYQTGSPLQTVQFKFNSVSTTNTALFLVEQKSVGGVARTLNFSWANGRWNAGGTFVNQALAIGRDYVAELRMEGLKANLYVYEKGAARGSTPIASQVAFDTDSKMRAIITNGSAQGMILRDMSTPTLAFVKAPAILPTVERMNYLKNLTVVKPSQTLIDAAVEFTAILYDRDAQLKEVLKKDGVKFLFEAGILKQAIGADGKVGDYSFQTSSLGNVTGSAIVKNGLKTSFDDDGFLASVEFEGETIHYKNQVIDRVERRDGSRFENLVFAADGSIKDAVLVTPGGDKRFYLAKQLTRELKMDGTETTFVGGLPSVTTMADGRVYNYTFVIKPDGKRETAGTLRKYFSKDGSLIYLTAGKPVRIEQRNGAALTNLRFGTTGLLLDADAQIPGPSGEMLTVLFRNAAITQITYLNGKKLIYEKNRLKSVQAPGSSSVAGETYEYEYDSNGKVLWFNIKTPAGTRIFSADGSLISFESDSLTAYYAGGLLSKLTYDGIEIMDPVVNASGILTGGSLKAPDGTLYAFSNSELNRILRPNGTEILIKGGLTDEIRVAGKTIQYLYIKSATGSLLDIQVNVTTGGTTVTKSFGEYLFDPSTTEETIVEGSASDYSLIGGYNVLGFKLANGTTPSITVPGNPADSQAKLFISNTLAPSSPVRSFELSYYKQAKADSFVYLQMKNGAGGRPATLGMSLQSYTEPTPLSTEVKGTAALSGTYKNFILPITKSYADQVTRIRFDLPLLTSATTSWSVSIAQLAHYTVKRFGPDEYLKYISLSTQKALDLVQLPEADIYRAFIYGDKVVLPFNSVKEAEEFPLEHRYDHEFKLVSTNRADGSRVYYTGDKATSIARMGGMVSAYSYQDGKIKEISTSMAGSIEGTVTKYEYGRVRSVTKKDGTLLYNYAYELESGGDEIIVITDVASGEIKKYRDEKLLSSQARDGIVTRYFYGEDRLAQSVVEWQGKELYRYRYSYEGENTLVTDDKNVIKTYGPDNKLLFIQTAEGLIYRYNYLRDDQNNPVEQQMLHSAKTDDGVTVFYKNDTVEKILMKDGTILNIAAEDPNLYQKVLIKQGLVDQVIHQSGEIATYVRDEKGRLTFVDVAKDGTTRRYTPDGDLVRVVQPDGITFHYGYFYDAAGNINKTRVVKRVAKSIGGGLPPVRLEAGTPTRLAADSAGYLDGWNSAIFVDDAEVGQFNYNYWKETNVAWTGRGYSIAEVDAAGKLVKSELFDIYAKGPTESDRMAAYIENVPTGNFVVISLADEGYWNLTERAKVAFESLGSAKIRGLGFRDSFALIGKKGALQGTAIEDLKKLGEGQAHIQSFTTQYAYYDKLGAPIPYNQFTSVPQNMWYSGVQMDTGDSAEVFATTGTGAAGFRKNFNEFHPDSGFIRMWGGEYTNVSTDAYVNDLVAMLANSKDRAVYYDENYPGSFTTAAYSRILKDKLVARGFKVLNAEALAEYVKTRGADSCVVMAQDIAPDTIYDPFSAFSIARRNLSREYMNKGGTMLWTHDTPFFYVGRKGQVKDTVGEIGARKILGVTPLYRGEHRYTETKEKFDAIPAGWTLSSNARIQGGRLVLAATPTEGASAFLNSYTPVTKTPTYLVDFTNKTVDSSFYIEMEGRGFTGESIVVRVEESNGVFKIRYWQEKNTRVEVVAPISIPYSTSKTYTVELNQKGGGVEIQFYEKGTLRPVIPAYFVQNLFWADQRLRVGLVRGTAEIDEVRIKTLEGEVQPVGGETFKPSFTLPANTPPLDLSKLYFDTNVNFRTIRWDKVKESIHHSLESDTSIVTDYDKDGDVISIAKADRTVTVYDKGKVQFVTDINGYMLVEYFYDAAGELTAIKNVGQRRDLADMISDAKERAAAEKAYALQDLATENDILTAAFLEQVATGRAQLAAARANAQNQLNELENTKVRGSSAKKDKSRALDQLRDVINQIDAQTVAFNEQVSVQIAALGAQYDQKKRALELDFSQAFTEMDLQSAQFEKEIRRSEAKPIVIHFYRTMMGRDATRLEIERYYPEILANGTLNTAAISLSIRNSAEYLSRVARSQRIRGDIAARLDAYLIASESNKVAILTSLGLSSSTAVHLNAQDIQKIKEYLNGQGLHFAESAIDSLISLMGASGITVNRDSVAAQLILTDIFMGIIHPFIDGELVISLFALKHVAKLRGVSGAATLNLSYEDLLAAYTARPSERFVVHVSDNHYIVVTKVLADQIHFLETNGEEIVLSNTEFLETWKGVTLVSDVTRVTAGATKAITDTDARSIRGAFFWIIPFVFQAVGALVSFVVGHIIAAITVLIGQLGVLMGNILAGLGQALGGLLKGVAYIGKAIFGGIKHVGVSLFKGFTKMFASTLAKSAVGGGLKTITAQSVFNTAIKIGLNFAVQKGLDLLGVDPRIGAVIGSFVTGGIHGGFTNVGFDFGSFLSSGLKSALIAGSKNLIAGTGLDPNLANILSLTSGSLIDGIWKGDIAGALRIIAPNIGRDVAQYGIQRLGSSIGLDPKIAGLIAMPISGAIGTGIRNGNIFGENLVRSIQDGFTAGIVQYGLDFSVDKMGINDPLLRALSSSTITTAVSSLMDPNGNLLRDILDKAQGQTAEFLEHLQTIDFNSLARSEGIIRALESTATSIFSRSAIEDIIRTGGIAQVISGRTSLVNIDGVTLKEVRINSKESFYLDTNNVLVAVKNQNGVTSEIQSGKFYITPMGARLMDGVIGTIHGDGSVSTIEVRAGKTYEIQVSKTAGLSTLTTTTGPEGQTWITFDIPQDQIDLVIKQNDTDVLNIENLQVIDGSFTYYGFSNPVGFKIFNGYATNISKNSNPGNTPNPVIQTAFVEYLLLNGIRGNRVSEGTPAPYFDPNRPTSFAGSLRDIGAQTNSIDTVALFEDDIVLSEVGDIGIDTLDVLLSALFTSKEKNDAKAKLKAIQNNQTEQFIPIGYSGGGQVLLENLMMPYEGALRDGFNAKYFNVETAILVGAPVLRNWISPYSKLNRIINIYSKDDPLKPLFASEFDGKSNVEVINIELQGGISHTNYFYTPDFKERLLVLETGYNEVAGRTDLDSLARKFNLSILIARLKEEITKTLYTDAFIARLAKASKNITDLTRFIETLAKSSDGKISVVDPKVWAQSNGLELASLKEKKNV